MNDHRQRTQTEITRDLMAVCHRIGAIAMQAEMNLSAPDTDELSRAHEGLGAVLRERRSATTQPETSSHGT